MAKGLLAILGVPKGKGGAGAEPASSEPEEPEDNGESAYLAEMKSAAAEQDWDGFAEATAAYVKACAGKM